MLPLQLTTPIVFDPTKLSGLVMWQAADQLPVASGQAVALWPDLSGNGNHLIQSGVATPILVPNILNGNPIVRFSGDWMLTKPFASVISQPLTIIVVTQATSVATDEYICDGISGGNRDSVRFFGPALRMFAGNDATVTGFTPTANTWYIFNTYFSGTASNLNINGTVSVLNSGTSTTSLTGVTLGSRFNQISFLPGDIAEFILYNRALTAPEKGQIDSYLSNKYNITVTNFSNASLTVGQTATSTAFTNTQPIDFHVDWHNSSMTVPETGIGFRLFSPNASFNTSGMQTTNDPATYLSTNGVAVLTNSGTFGMSPLVMDYWGGGAPAGIATPGYVALHWRGFWTNALTQLVADPINFSNWTQFGTPILTGGQLDPFGGTSAYLLQDDDVAVLEGLQHSVTFSGDGLKTLTLFVKSDSNTPIFFELRDQTTGLNRLDTSITWSNGIPNIPMTVGTLLSNESWGNGWYKLSFQTILVTSADSHTINIRIGPSGGATGTIFIFNINAWNAGFVPKYEQQAWFLSSGTENFLPASGWVSFSGKGFIRVQRNGADILNGRLNPLLHIESSLIAPVAGDLIDIFYWQLGEDWGGLVGKFVPQYIGQASSSNMLAVQHRDAPVLSASMMPYSVANPVTLPQASDARIENTGAFSATTLEFRLPLSNQTDPAGWKLLSNPRRAQFTSSTVGTTKSLAAMSFIGNTTSSFVKVFPVLSGIWPSTNLTCECWFKGLSSDVPKSNFGILSYASTARDNSILLLADTSLPVPSMSIFVAQNQVTTPAIPQLLDGNWHHLCATWQNSNGALAFYFDGINIYNTTVGTGQIIQGGNGSFYIAQDQDSVDGGLDKNQALRCSLDEVRVYSRTISAAEALQHYQGSFTNNSNLVLHWSFEEQSTTFVLDQSGTGHNGVAKNCFIDTHTKDTITLRRGQLIKFYGGFQNEQYSRFTGRITNINENNGYISIECQDFIERLQRLNVQNYPDFLSYASFNYFNFSNSNFGQPVYGIPAYDNWPLEHAIKDLSYRGGIDSKLLYCPQQVNNVNGIITPLTNLAGTYQYLTRARSVAGQPLLLQRNARYGNVGGAFDPHKNADDLYIYRGNATQAIADWSRELADTLGYDWRFDANGNMMLLPRNNSSRLFKFISGTTQYSPTAIGGTYQENTSSFSTVQTINAERIDLAVGRSINTGILNYRVDLLSGLTVASGQINTGLLTASSTGVFIYDNEFDTVGNNLCIFTLYEGVWGSYNVTLSNIGGGIWWLDSLLAWDRNPNVSRLPSILQTDLMIEQLSSQSLAQESVNDVIAIGAIKSTITDNQKAETFNNPDYEYYVARAVDPSSIWDASATNYFGGRISSIIVDKKISNQNYANWVAQTLLIRQRDPGPSVRLQHSILPFIEPRDRLALLDQAFGTIQSTDSVWVQTYSETYEKSSATSELTLTSYAQIPSYEPNQSLTADQIDANFFGQPIINFTVSYPSIDSGTVVNPGINLTDARIWGNPTRSYYQRYDNDFTSYTTDGQGDYINLNSTNIWPPIPDSIALGYPSGSILNAPGSPQIAIYKNNPYMKFTHIFDYNQQRIYVPCQAGDGTAAYTKSGTGFNLLTGHISYLGIDKTILSNVYSGVCPFYDPYMSELPDGNLINVSFDTLVTGYYRISIWGAKNLSSPTLVAWLTEPTSRDPDPESHWTYLTAGRGNIFQWDGVDNIGEWNAKQSENYSWAARGWFEKNDKPSIGAGYYVWNDQTSEIAVISNQLANGKLVFNPDHYSQFFVKIECQNDDFASKALAVGDSTAIRVTNSYDLKGVAQGQNAKSQVFIYTHLPQPTTIQITGIEDWNFKLFGSYDPLINQFGSTGWVSSGDYAASIRNDKPVRITYQALPRPGSRFQNNRAYTSFKMHNVIHLNLGILDSFMMFMGQTWNTRTGIEMKRLVNRRLLNDQNTLELVDADWRTGDTLDLPTGKWAFRPQDLTIESNGTTSSIRYCDYLQITDVPGFSQDRSIGQPWSRLIIAYLAYLFYLSTYIQDRSGRMTWAIDTNFIDKSKIVKNTFSTTHPEQLEEYSARTIIARQWVDPGYASNLATTWQIPTLVSGQATASIVQFFHQRLDINDNISTDPLAIDTNGTAVNGFIYTGFTDPYSQILKNPPFNGVSFVPSRLLPNPGTNNSYLTNRQLGAWNSTTNRPATYLGLWTWEGDYTPGATQQYDTQTDPLWIPDLTRDFHPFFLVPPMPYELSRIPFWTKKVLPTYGDAHIYDNYTRYIYGQGTGDPNQSASAFEVWVTQGFPANDTRFNGTHIYWKNIGIDIQHAVDFTIPDNTSSGNKSGIYSTAFNYTRQQEWKFWENYRGNIVAGNYVSPGSPYLMNFLRYELMVRSSNGVWGDNAFSLSVTGINNTIDSSLLATPPFEYVTQIRPYSAANSRDRSWFTWTFRREFNWYSSSYFPVTSEFKLHPRFLYPKYSITNAGQPPLFDAGAWVGWKDDNDVGSGITWYDAIVEAGHFGLFNPKPFLRDASSPNDNIFISAVPRMPMAQGPRLAESTDVMITLSLVNNRRKNPISGVGP